MKTFYFILMSLFVFGAVSTMFNTAGVFPTSVPVQSQTSITQTQITDLTNTTKGNVNPLFELSFMAVFIGSFIGGIISMFYIVPLLTSFGIPLYIALMFQGPIWIVEIFGIYALITGKDVEN